MEKAYIILAHKNPAQVARLITALDDNHSTFFLHYDKKSDPFPYAGSKFCGCKLVAVKSIATQWGSFGLVEATLEGIKAVMDHKKHFDFVSLISGQHYPVKSNEAIHDYLSSTPHRAFVEYSNIPDYDRWMPRGGMYRIDSYFFGLGQAQRYAAKTLNFLSHKIGFLKRKFPENMQPYGGSQWWTMDNKSLQYIFRFVKNNEAYLNFNKQGFAPDELFFHNILLNADDDNIRSGIANDNLLYLSWPNKRAGHPEILRTSDFQNIITSEALFARKFDVQQDDVILRLLDEHRAG